MILAFFYFLWLKIKEFLFIKLKKKNGGFFVNTNKGEFRLPSMRVPAEIDFYIVEGHDHKDINIHLTEENKMKKINNHLIIEHLELQGHTIVVKDTIEEEFFSYKIETNYHVDYKQILDKFLS